MAAPRLLVDENLSPDLAEALRQRGYDAIHVADIGLEHVDDDIIFAAATRDGRAVVT